MSTSPDVKTRWDAWPLRLAQGVWGIVLLVILVRAVMQPNQHSVYPIFANAAREWDHGIDLYDRTLPHQELDVYRYAPIIAATFSPLAVLPDAIGGVLWRIVNGAVFLGGVLVFARTIFPGRAGLSTGDWALVAWALLPLSAASMNNGQPNSLIIGCLLVGAAAIWHERWTLASVCLAVPVLFKVYPLAVVLLFLLIHPARLAWRTCLAIAAGLALPFLMQNPTYVAQVYESWVGQVAKDNRRANPLEYSYRDFHTLARACGHPIDDAPYAVIQLAAAALVAGVVLRGHWQGWSRRHHLRAALDLGCCWMIVFGPATENATYALLAPTFALAVWESFQAGQPVWKRWPMIVIVLLLVASTLATAMPLGRNVSFFLMPSGALLLFVERLAHFTRRQHPLGTRSVEAQVLPRAA